jgi:protein-arginine kinase activator protein McsA
MIAAKARDGKCPNCGWTENRLIETGMLGCPLCYEAFGDPVWHQFGIERKESALHKAI